VYRWFLIDNLLEDQNIIDVRRFLSKTCPKVCNRKDALGIVQIRKIWDAIDREYPDLDKVPAVTLRTFVMTVIQYASFCRYSDIAELRLDDVVYHMDYFQLNIRFSKTDQAGAGQTAFVPRNGHSVRCPHKLMCLFLHKMHNDPNPDVYLFPPLE
jgi:hypothetical protein